jgi:hypothetical protein
MCAAASTVLRAVVADFFFNCWYLEIPFDNRIRHIPRCVHQHAQRLRLELDDDDDGDYCYYDYYLNCKLGFARWLNGSYILKKASILHAVGSYFDIYTGIVEADCKCSSHIPGVLECAWSRINSPDAKHLHISALS